ncbi:MAG: ABC transporter permease [Cyclobacteriaceae bacterium]|nr:ABC transporter permease [Cyclobacteriaceae bacterium]
MLKNYFQITMRTFLKHKGFSFINVAGLSIGLACSLLIFLWVSDERGIDRFHEKDERLYQVMQNMSFPGGIHTTDATPGLLADALLEEVPEIEDATVEYPGRGSKGIISFGDTRVNASERYVSSNYFDVFSYKLLQGNKDQVLSGKYSVVLSEELALKLFNTSENVIGKTVEWDQGNLTGLKGLYVVSGVFEKPGKNSSAQFDILFTYELLFENYASMLGLNHWGGSDPGTFVIVKAGTDVERLNLKIRDFVRSKFSLTRGNQNLEDIGTLFLQQYSDRYLNNRYENGIPVGGRIEYVRLFSIIAIFILIIACINFMNLATAKASGRIKEIGIKKALGADRRTLILQFLRESVTMAFLTLPIAIVIVELFLPHFNIITGKHLSLSLDANIIIAVLLITLMTGLVSGSYPALYLSGFRPATVLKGKFSVTPGGASRLRSALVIFQFAVSVMLIVAVLVVNRQVEFIHSKNLGYSKDNIIHFVTKGNVLAKGYEPFLNEIKKIPGVVNAANYQSNLVTKDRKVSVTNVSWEGKSPNDIVEFKYLVAGYDFIETLGVALAEGRSFSREFASEEDKIIFNEAAIESMGLKDPVGKTVLVEGREKTIVGITRNFHFESFYEPIKPCYFVLRPDRDYIMVRIESGKEKETLERVGAFYREYNEGLLFEFEFLDEDYKTLYASEQKVAALSRYFAGLAILISCLGLFGLAAFTAERRTKEIGIRKILGSSVLGIVFLLSGDFTRKVFTALLIALPLSHYITKSWLDNFAYKIAIEWWYFIGAGVLTILIALLTVSSQAVKAALANPVDSLRNE